jgi:GTP-binding protein
MRHEPFTPRGGPDGGDGGRGGSVVVRAASTVTSLARFEHQRAWQAQEGAHGAAGRKQGRLGRDLVLEVPHGTVVRDGETAMEIADLDTEGAAVTVAQGGAGGRGNVHFATPARRAPRISEPGLPGEDRWIELELKLIADVGLVGPPNAGKSSLLASMTSARPKVAPYAFTTLDPQLGVADAEGTRIVLADLPGIIPGASRGAGLGLRFLRHAERTGLLVLVADGAADDPWGDLWAVRQEIAAYSSDLVARPSLTVLNKIDLPSARQSAIAAPRGAVMVSALTGEGISDLLSAVARRLSGSPRPTPAAGETGSPHKLRLRPVVAAPPRVERQPWGFLVHGERAERLVRRSDLESEDGLQRFQVALDRAGINQALVEAGVQPGDAVRIADLEFEYQP